uniref:Uncharacterized protein LOC111110662 n=1 Tax=Crassostrea virginica TaxID=6565 RepID=A0A8B8BHX1_CRAVI|nr:uncharacterized protein LOC111110662 [Crassostrea virginica]
MARTMLQVPQDKLQGVSISLYLIWIFLEFVALDMISLKISDVFIQYGQSDIEISCVVNCSNQINVDGIQLLRSNIPILSLTSNNEIKWHDLELESRSEATTKPSCRDGDVSYLRVEIPSSRIKPVKDSGPYMCRLRGFTRHDTPFHENSGIIMLNITGGFDASRSSKDSEQGGMLRLYRAMIILTGIMISFILALIMVREVRMHYFQREAK